MYITITVHDCIGYSMSNVLGTGDKLSHHSPQWSVFSRRKSLTWKDQGWITNFPRNQEVTVSVPRIGRSNYLAQGIMASAFSLKFRHRNSYRLNFSCNAHPTVRVSSHTLLPCGILVFGIEASLGKSMLNATVSRRKWSWNEHEWIDLRSFDPLPSCCNEATLWVKKEKGDEGSFLSNTSVHRPSALSAKTRGRYAWGRERDDEEEHTVQSVQTGFVCTWEKKYFRVSVWCLNEQKEITM